MPKTVHVVDEAGNRYEATYLKRAEGLVKKGRARFIDENTICLVCPPNQNDLFSEDKTMENTMKHTDDTIKTTAPHTEETAFLLPETDDPECIRFTNQHNVNYCLKKIDEIGKETETIKDALIVIQELESSAGSPDEPANAVAAVIRAREETIQKKIDFYRDMIDRFLPPKKDEKAEHERRKEYLDWITNTLIGSDMAYEILDLVTLYREFT